MHLALKILHSWDLWLIFHIHLILLGCRLYKNNNLDYVTFEPSEGTAIVFPSYLQYKIDVNLSDEDFIYFKSDMSLVTVGDVITED